MSDETIRAELIDEIMTILKEDARLPDKSDGMRAAATIVDRLKLAGMFGQVHVPQRRALFEMKDFIMKSGTPTSWKVECDALTDRDLQGLARMARDLVPPFGATIGIPRGGVRFAEAMSRYATDGAPRTLVCDDVLTTGGSFEEARGALCSHDGPDEYSKVAGLVIFARGPCPPWITPIWRTDAR